MLERIGFRGAGQEPAWTRLCQRKGVTRDAFDPSPREDPGLFGKLVRCSTVEAATDPAVLALRVLPDAHHVDVRRRSSPQRRIDARQQAHRPQVDVLPQLLAEGKDHLPCRDVVRHARVADRAEVDRVELEHLLDPVRVEHAPCAEIEVGSPREVGELTLEASLCGSDLHDLDARGDHFLSDAVSGNHCNAIRFHLSTQCYLGRRWANHEEHEDHETHQACIVVARDRVLLAAFESALCLWVSVAR